MSWPEPVQRVAAVLEQAAAEAWLEEFPDGTLTAEAAARAVGCKLVQIVRSLVVCCATSSASATGQREYPSRCRRCRGALLLPPP
jgi:hypothetical protein